MWGILERRDGYFDVEIAIRWTDMDVRVAHQMA